MRPLGVTLSAYFQFVRAALVAILAIGVMFVSGTAARVASIAAEGNVMQRFLSGFGDFIGTALLAYSVIFIVLGVGLLLRYNWARGLTVFFSALGILTLIPMLIKVSFTAIFFAVLNLIVLLYLLLPSVKATFKGQPVAASSNETAS